MSNVPTLHAQVAALRSQGAARVAPARLLQLEALVRRQATQPAPVQALLQARALAQVQEVVRALQAALANGEVPMPAPSVQPQVPWPRPAHASHELASAQRFKRAWARTHTQDSVQRAILQRPANAGPLNSQALVLDALAMLGDLPGDYLHRFIGHAESLLWLEAAGAQAAPAPARKPRRPARPAT
jgi:hypothetical protein